MPRVAMIVKDMDKIAMWDAKMRMFVKALSSRRICYSSELVFLNLSLMHGNR